MAFLMNVIKYANLVVSAISLVIKYVPTVLTVVKYVEEFYKEKDGQEKKKIAMEMLEEILSHTNLSEDKKKNILNAVSGLIDLIVSTLNLKKLW